MEPTVPESLPTSGTIDYCQQHMPEDLDVDAAAANNDETFFSTQPFPQRRPFKEIITPVQGNFDYLQDSEIDPGMYIAEDLTYSFV